MADSIGFQTQREQLLSEYERAGVPFIASTVPIHSTRSVKATIVNPNLTTGIAWAVFQPQRVRFLDYGVGDNITMGSNTSHSANENDTNLAKAKSTNGAADVVIEGLGMSIRGRRIEYAPADIATLQPGADVAVAAVLAGITPIADPAALFLPPQVGSPANLEEALAQFFIRNASIEFEFDRRRTEKLGTLATLPEAGGNSYLRSNGVPTPDDRWLVREGYRWNRDGQPDSELVVYVTTYEALCIPISLVAAPIAPNPIIAPVAVYADLVLKLSGLQISLPGTN
jgi:hypothetical protein